jgi:hypothetical protein
MVLGEFPGEPYDYGVCCIAPLFDGQLLADFILEPDFKRDRRGRFYRVVLGGFLFMFYVSAVRLEDKGEQLFIQKNGQWNIPVIDAQKIEFLREEAKRMARRRSGITPRSSGAPNSGRRFGVPVALRAPAPDHCEQ